MSVWRESPKSTLERGSAVRLCRKKIKSRQQEMSLHITSTYLSSNETQIDPYHFPSRADRLSSPQSSQYTAFRPHLHKAKRHFTVSETFIQKKKMDSTSLSAQFEHKCNYRDHFMNWRNLTCDTTGISCYPRFFSYPFSVHIELAYWVNPLRVQLTLKEY